MGLVAVALEIVFSAFSTIKSHKQNDEFTTYKWYTVSYASPYQANGAVLQSTDLPFGSTFQTQSYAVDNDGCLDSGSKNFVRGFTSGNEPTSFPSELSGQSQTPRPN